MRDPACRPRHCWLVGSIASLLTCGSASSAELSGFDCLIEPHSVAEVSTRELGTIAEISVVRGDLIEKDQQLARLESSVEEAAVALARGRTEMVANIDARHANVRFLERQRDRVGELYEKKALPYHEMDKAETDVELAKLAVREAEENMHMAELELTRAEQALARRTIFSPVDGVMVRQLLSPGESVEDRPILIVAQVSPLNVEIILPVELFGSIALGMQAEVTPRVPGVGVHVASVVVVDRVIDAASNTFGVRLELSNSDYAIPGGVWCDISFMSE
ncbi:MAG: efflux RND transporter periplasmic adaptor subunit [Gammaproteobacteria bacterium]|nr:efflux RND transporter periplasmic adaptor subunit [Gammaproteobacteria bacterium]